MYHVPRINYQAQLSNAGEAALHRVLLGPRS